MKGSCHPASPLHRFIVSSCASYLSVSRPGPLRSGLPKPFLKPLGMVVALAAAGAFTADAAYARPAVAADERGDLALAPYYTVRGEWVTGLHIVNTSQRTQVVKVRFRRATDGMNRAGFQPGDGAPRRVRGFSER